MSNDPIAAQIGQAWRYQREGKMDAAIAEFERILRMNPDNVDANYGIGLAQRALGQYEAAIKHFEHARKLVEADAAARRPNSGELLVANTPEDDRNMMLTRMINQRLVEINNAMKPRT